MSIISAISPPGGDVTEPVSRHTQRFTPTFWRLSKERAEARVFPAVDIQESYGEVPAELEAWWSRTTSPEWSALRREALGLLETAAVLERTARLVGAESLPERERFLLRMASLFEEGFLRQSAFDPKDAFCSPRRQLRLLRLFLRVRDRGLAAIEGGVEEKRLGALPALARLERAKSQIGEDELARFDELESALDGELAALVGSGR